jgi:hypothetical protein
MKNITMKLSLFLAGLLLLCLLAVAGHARFFIQMQGGQGPPQRALFTAITMSELTFTTGAAGGVGTAVATVSGAPASPTWSIKTTGTDTATNTQCHDYSADFTIDPNSGAVSNTVGAPAQNYPGFCVQAAQAGLTNTPFSMAFQLVGTAVTPTSSTFDITRNTGTNFTFSPDELTVTAAATAPTNSDFSAFTTGFHSDVKRFFRFTVGTRSMGCGQGIGLATSTESNGSYLGHLGSNSFGIYTDGTTSLNGQPLGNTGLTFSSGSKVDIIVDPVAKTAVEVVDGGTPSAPINISTLSSQNVSPAVSLCAATDSMVFNGNPAGVSYAGAIAWDGSRSGIFVVRGIDSHMSTTQSGNSVIWTLPSPAIGSGNTVLGFTHTAAEAPISVTDNAGNSYTLGPSVVWQPYNELISMWYKVGVTGNPTQISINYADSSVSFCDCGFVEYSGATAIDSIINPIVTDVLNPSITVSPSANSSLIWVFSATDTTGTFGCQQAGNGNMISPSGYSVLIDDCAQDGIGVLGSPATVGPGPITFTWQDTFWNATTCSDGTSSGSTGCTTVLMGAAVRGGAAQFTGIAMSNLTFTTGSASPVGTATASVSSGTTTPTWSLKLSGTDSSGTACVDNSSHFTIDPNSGVVTPNVNDAAQSYPGTCIQAAQAGFSNTPFSQAFQLVGSASGALAVTVNPTSVTEPCNAAAGLTISNVAVSGGNGQPVTLSLTAGGTDFALDSFSPPAHVTIGASGITTSGFACGSLPGGGANETVTVTATQPPPGGGSSPACSTVPAVAAAAGLTSQAHCNDWTAGLPSTAGTGLSLPAGAAPNSDCVGGVGCWYGDSSSGSCSPGDNEIHVWYVPEKGYCWFQSQATPNDGGVHLLKDTDPTYGSGLYAEDFSTSVAQENQGGDGFRAAAMSANVGDLNSVLYTDFPTVAYTEIIARTNVEDNTCGDPANCGQPNFDFFTQSVATYLSSNACNIEYDSFEAWGNPSFSNGYQPGGGGAINWCTQNGGTGGWNNYSVLYGQFGNNFTMKKYHKYGELVTSDGTNILHCAFIDDQLVGTCGAPNGPYRAIGAQLDNTGSVAQRRNLHLWSLINHQTSGAQNQCPDSTGAYANWCQRFPDASSGFSTSAGPLGKGIHVLVQSISAWSCGDWKRGSTGPNPSCFGQATITNDANGSQYYKVVTQ